MAQTEKLNEVATVTTVNTNQRIVLTDASGNVTTVSLANLKASIMSGMDANAIEDGVFIMFHRKSDNYPLMVKPHNWASYQTSGEIAEGVVVFEGGKHIVVAPTEAATKLTWSSAAVSAGGFTTTDRLTAMADFAGRTSTTAQKTHSECNTENHPVGFCDAYSRTNANGQGLTAGRYWLPSLGEMIMIYANMTKINYALSLINGATQLVADAYWTSTECSQTHAWYCSLYDGYINYNAKATGTYRVRPVSAFIK